MEARLLYIYLWTNSRCNQAGLYEIGIETIAGETGIDCERIPQLLEMLAKKVTWFVDDDLIWVKNFIKRQAKSPKFLIAVARCLKEIHNPEIVKEVINFNEEKYRISIPYTYPIDTLSIGYGYSTNTYTDTDTNTGSNPDKGEKGVCKREEGEKQIGDRHEIPVKELFDFWNSLGIVKHRTLTGDMTRALRAALRDFSAAEISQAMKNYAHIVNDEQCYFSYRWVLKDFLKRGMEKFLDLEVARSNYRRKGVSSEREIGIHGHPGRDRAPTREEYLASLKRHGIPHQSANR